MNVQFLHQVQDKPFDPPHTEDLKITILNYDPSKFLLSIDTRAPYRDPSKGDLPYQNDVTLANHLAATMMKAGILPTTGQTIYVRVSMVEAKEDEEAANTVSDQPVAEVEG